MKSILEEAKGKKKSQGWFRSQFLSALKKASVAMMRPKKGELLYFEYDGQQGKQDRYPLVYVVNVNGETFFGANLHMVKPEKRLKIVDDLLNNKISLPKEILFTYSAEYILTEMYPVPKEEWANAASLPLEKFYKANAR